MSLGEPGPRIVPLGEFEHAQLPGATRGWVGELLDHGRASSSLKPEQ